MSDHTGARRTGASAVGRGGRRLRRRWALAGGTAAAVVALGAGGAGWLAYAKLSGNITPDRAAAAELARYAGQRPSPPVRGAQNILLIGSDSRAGHGNARYGRDGGSERSDTTILLHLSAGRRSATAVSLPRDLMVDVPGCRRRDDSRSEPAFTMFNSAFATGGSACTIRTVEKLTGIRVDHHVVVDFQGFRKMVDAVDGVRLCLPAPIHDTAARLKLPAGRVTLDGEQALGYVRARKSLGDGSDTERMDRQQRFLGALVNKVQSNGVLLNPVRLYPVLDAATSSLTTDPGLANLRGLYDLVRGLHDIPTEQVRFLTVPRESYVNDSNRDQLVESEARKLFDRLRRDAPVTVARKAPHSASDSHEKSDQDSYTQSDDYDEYLTDDGKPAGYRGAAASDPVSPAPTFRGNTAAEDLCG
ncbi:LCP family protein [Streptomyces sp. ACT015]|uniref:LCP family protein n=1 Tax=Streptomyces sp. ACT015 TaxID=3134807 RepID=UPI003D16B1C1